MAVAAIVDEGCLERRFDPRHLGEIDVALQLLALSAFVVEFLDSVAAHHHDPGFLGMRGVDKHS